MTTIERKTETKDDRFRRLITDNRTDTRRKTGALREQILGIHIPTVQDKLLNEQIDWMLDSIVAEFELMHGNETQQAAVRGGRPLLVTGKAGAGKSRAIEYAFMTRPEFDGYPDLNAGSPVLSVVASSPFTLGALGNELLRGLGYKTDRDVKQSQVWPMVSKTIEGKGVRIIHIDEAQHGDETADHRTVQEVENTLKRLMQYKQWPVWLILSGLPELGRFCQSDPSMRRRIRVVHFGDLEFPKHLDAVKVVIEKLTSLCPGMLDESLLLPEFAHRLMHAAMYQFGILVEYVQDAILECIDGGDERLSVFHFADVYALRSGESSDPLNPFIARDFLAINVETALFEEEDDGAGGYLKRMKKRGRSR